MISKDRPENFTNALDVVGCYLEHDGKFLLLQRHPKQSHASKWCQPAGKVDAGETIQQAMKRELFEETGLVVDDADLKFLSPVYVDNNGGHFIFHAFTINFSEKPEIKLNPYEHVDYKWITPSQALQVTDLIHDFEDTMKLFYKI